MKSLSDRYREVRATSEWLCEPLSAEDCAVQSMPDASPAKWHMAHTTWFFETMVLEPRNDAFRPFDPHYRVLFNSYYNSVGEQYPRPDRGLLSRPPLEEVKRYRAHVDAAMLALLEDEATLGAAAAGVVELGLHHEQQHQELILTDLKHMLSHNPLRPAYRPRTAAPGSPAETKPHTWHRFEGGVRQVGHGGRGFCFDNELPRHRTFTEDFELGSRPVTNGEFQAFIEAGGYRQPELWLSDGWTAVHERGWDAPLYWQHGPDGWDTFTLAGLEAVRPEEPVCHVSFYEADAYASWVGARLPTESEWELAAATAPIEGNFVESERLHPAPAPSAGEFPSQLFGDVWEWTASAYTPYPGFRPASGALGEYNGKFMSGQMVLRGGSCATPRSHIRPTYRNFFYPDDRWQLSGIRLARDCTA